jgi:hypothetical protein
MQLSIETKIMKRQLTQAVTTFIERCRNQLIPILQSTYYNKQIRKCTYTTGTSEIPIPVRYSDEQEVQR